MSNNNLETEKSREYKVPSRAQGQLNRRANKLVVKHPGAKDKEAEKKAVHPKDSHKLVKRHEQAQGDPPAKMEDFVQQVNDIQSSAWFIESRDQVLTEVFEEMSKLWVNEDKETSEDRSKYEKFLAMGGKKGKKTEDIRI